MKGDATSNSYNIFRHDYWFGQVSSRPLSIFRIFFGFILLKDALFHFPIAKIFFTEEGIVPQWAMQNLIRANRFSLLDAMPQPWMVNVFFALWVIVAILFITGTRTRLITVIQFVMLISVHERDIFILNGADTVIRTVSFWIMFLPLGDYYSVDALTRRLGRYARSHSLPDLRVEESPHTAYAFPLRMVQIQVAMVYLFTGILKIPGFAWREGTGVFYALQVHSLALPTGDWLLANGPMWFLQILNWQTLITEWTFFWFVFFPVGQPYLRIIALTLGAMLHLGIATFMTVGNFPAVMISAYFLFWDPRWVEWVDRKLRRLITPARIALPAEGSPLWLLLAVTGPEEIAVDKAEANSGNGPDSWWIEDSDGARLEGVDAWVHAAGLLPLSRIWAWMLRAGFVRRTAWSALGGIVTRNLLPEPEDRAVAAVKEQAQSRHLFSRGFSALIGILVALGMALLIVQVILGKISLPPSEWALRDKLEMLAFVVIPSFLVGKAAIAAIRSIPAERRLGGAVKSVGRIGLTAFLAGMMAAVLWWNLTTVNDANGPIIRGVPAEARTVMQFASMWQAWDMFSPYPSTVDGWIVVPGKFEDGTTFDLSTGLPLTQVYHEAFFGPSVRWKKYESNLSRNNYDSLLNSWAGYYCNHYNADLALPTGQRLATLEIHFYSRQSHAPGEPPNPLDDRLLWKHWCYAEYEY